MLIHPWDAATSDAEWPGCRPGPGVPGCPWVPLGLLVSLDAAGGQRRRRGGNRRVATLTRL